MRLSITRLSFYRLIGVVSFNYSHHHLISNFRSLPHPSHKFSGIILWNGKTTYVERHALHTIFNRPLLASINPRNTGRKHTELTDAGLANLFPLI